MTEGTDDTAKVKDAAAPAATTSPALATELTIPNIAAVLQGLITLEPKIVSIYDEFEAVDALAPPPYNVLANPLFKEAVDSLPKFVGGLQKMHDLLLSLNPA